MCKQTEGVDSTRSADQVKLIETKPVVDDPYTPFRRLRCLLTLVLLTAFLPLTLCYVAMCMLFSVFKPNTRRPVTADSKVVMVTGGKMTKSLHFARCFWKCGYKVVMVETEKYWYVGSRWSRAVQHMEVVPCPRSDPEGYVQGLVRVAKKYNADFFVPVASPAAAVSDAAAKSLLEKNGCQVLHFDLATTRILDDKHAFCQLAHELGLPAPESHHVDSDEEAIALNRRLQNNGKTYILKNLEYDPIHRLDLFKMPCSDEKLKAYLRKVRDDGNGVEPHAPWQAQQFISGEEYTCMAVLRDGQVRAITTAPSSASQLNYEHIELPSVTQWLIDFSAKTKLTGQLCFDFLRDGTSDNFYPIECNPRVHSQALVYQNGAAFGDAILADEFEGCLAPPKDSPDVFWFYNELFKLAPDSIFHYGQTRVIDFLRMLVTQRDADMDVEDPLPFVLKNHVQLPGLLSGTLLKGTPWKKLDFCIGKVVELGGD